MLGRNRVILITPYELAFASLVLIVSAFLLVIYYRWTHRIKREYEDAKGIIQKIVIDFNKKQRDQIAKTESLIFDVEAARSTSEKVAEQICQEEKKIEKIVSNVEVSLIANAKIAKHLLKIYKKLAEVGEVQASIQKQLNILSEKQTRPILEPEVKNQGKRKIDVLNKLTDTERTVIQMLANEGPKSAPYIGKKLGRSREHTARLMKKLFEEGYIERETYKIPYVYRLNEKLKETLEKQRAEAGQ
jgi:predicted transcriptional regulator